MRLKAALWRIHSGKLRGKKMALFTDEEVDSGAIDDLIADLLEKQPLRGDVRLLRQDKIKAREVFKEYQRAVDREESERAKKEKETCQELSHMMQAKLDATGEE